MSNDATGKAQHAGANDEVPENRRGHFGEAILLAISPVVAYVVAFAFESGYAEGFGYPTWVIEIQPANVAIAWAGMATGLVSLWGLSIVMATVIPMRLARVVFTWPVFAVSAPLLVVWMAWWMAEAIPSIIAAWLATGVTALFGCFAFLIARIWHRRYLATDPSLLPLERWALAAKDLGSANLEYDKWRRQNQPWSIIDHTNHPSGVPAIVAWGMVALIVALLLLGPAGWLGLYRSRVKSEFLVTSSQPELVAIRRFGSTLVAAEVSRQQVTAFHLVAVTDDERVWVHQRIGRIEAIRTCTRDRMGLTMACE